MDSNAKKHLDLAVNKIKDNERKMTREIKELKDLITQKCDFLYNSTLKLNSLLNNASVEIKIFAAEVEYVKKTGRMKCKFSDAFFCLDGYRAKLRVKIDKEPDGIAYTGACFMLEKGPYDDRLKWPFRGNVIFSCKGNDHAQPKTWRYSTYGKSSEVIEYDFKKHFIQIIGYQEFLNCDEVDNYVINDTVKIEIQVSEEKP